MQCNTMKYKATQLSSISWPKACLSLISSGNEVESRMNLTCNSELDPSILISRFCSGGQSAHLSSHKLCSLCRICCRAGQTIRRCSKSPQTAWQVSARQCPLLLLDQNLHIISVLYLPLTILANTVLLEHSKLLPAALVHIGCG